MANRKRAGGNVDNGSCAIENVDNEKLAGGNVDNEKVRRKNGG